MNEEDIKILLNILYNDGALYGIVNREINPEERQNQVDEVYLQIKPMFQEVLKNE